jgi:hypothetical protein
MAELVTFLACIREVFDSNLARMAIVFTEVILDFSPSKQMTQSYHKLDHYRCLPRSFHFIILFSYHSMLFSMLESATKSVVK